MKVFPPKKVVYRVYAVVLDIVKLFGLGLIALDSLC